MKSRLLRYGFILLFCLMLVTSSSAMSVTINYIVGLWGDCVSTFMVQANLTLVWTTSDPAAGGGDDAFTFVVYDGYGTAMGTGEFSIGMGTNFTGDYYATPVLGIMPQARPVTIIAYDTENLILPLATIESYPLLDSMSFDPAAFGLCGHLPLVGGEEAGEEAPFNDGRINNWDTASPVVLFGHDGETGRGLVIYSPQGELLLVVSAEEIAAVEECPAENTLIASAGDIALYRLTDCHYQLNAPSLDGTKTYVLIFNDLYENTGYTSYEE